jgi:hypothetical protein
MGLLGSGASANARQAAATLAAQFGQVPTALMAIVNSNNDKSIVDEQVATINAVRYAFSWILKWMRQ